MSKKRRFEFIISENVDSDAGVISIVSMRFGTEENGYSRIDHRFKCDELTPEQILEAADKLMRMFLPVIPCAEGEAHAKGVVFNRTQDGKFEHA